MHVPSQAEAGKLLLDADALSRTLSRIAHEIIEGNPELDRVALVGIQTRGVPLAQRLARLIEERAGETPELGAVDITFYRDDVTVRGGEAPLAAQPLVRATQARSSIRRARRRASGTPRVWIPTSATSSSAGLPSMISWAILERVLPSPSASRRIFP